MDDRPARRTPARRRGLTRGPLQALLALLVVLVVGYAVRASHGSGGAYPSAAAMPTVSLSSLPAQAVTTVQLIHAGGPFPYPGDDGVVFHNDEHRLPKESDGWYREYTVPTPGADDRGARRIVAGHDRTLYWTANHYDSFSLIVGAGT